jgi:nicotinate-nucleotide--dimethylbenzimidazole phosphoribosyltransferase
MSEALTELLESITPLNKKAQRKFLINQCKIAKPLRSLGLIDDIVYKASGIYESIRDEQFEKTIFVLAGDHGISSENISVYKSSVTAKVLALINSGKAPINIIANQHSAKLIIADLGVIGDTQHLQNVLQLKIREGTSNFSKGPAMSIDETLAAIFKGISLIESLDFSKQNIIALGEIGIGNTTASSIITSFICKVNVKETIGRGTGISDEVLQKKIFLAQESISINALSNNYSAIELLSVFGGFEIAGAVGIILAAASEKIPIVIDGFITTTAAAIAVLLNENVKNYLFASHLSAEKGHTYLLDFLELTPILDIGMKLGMASGAGIVMSLFELGCKIAINTAPIEELDITQYERN